MDVCVSELCDFDELVKNTVGANVFKEKKKHLAATLARGRMFSFK